MERRLGTSSSPPVVFVHASTEPRSPPSSTFPPSRRPWPSPLPLRALLSCIEQQERAPPRVDPCLDCDQRVQGPASLLSLAATGPAACLIQPSTNRAKPNVRSPPSSPYALSSLETSIVMFPSYYNYIPYVHASVLQV